MGTISWEDFEKVELRVGTIVDVQDFPVTKTEVSGFSVQVSVFFLLTPDTRHLKPRNSVLGNRGPARRVGCPKDQFDILQHSNTPVLQSSSPLVQTKPSINDLARRTTFPRL